MFSWNSGCLVPTTQGNVATLTCIISVFENAVNALLVFAGVIAVIVIIISGIHYITARADPKQIETARHTLVYAIFGLFLVILSFLILNMIAYITGVECIKLFGFDSCK